MRWGSKILQFDAQGAVDIFEPRFLQNFMPLDIPTDGT